MCVTPLESTHKTRRLEVGMERKITSKSERQREERIMVDNRKNRALRRNVILLQFGEQGRGFTCGRMLDYMCEALGLAPSTTERKQPRYGYTAFRLS